MGLPVDEEGCHVSQRDTDLDGVTDDADNCPTEPKGEDGFDDGCPRPTISSDDGGGLLGDLSTGLIAAIAGGVVALLVLLAVLIRVVRGDEDDEDDDYDDFYDDDEEEENFLDRLDRTM